MAAKKTKKARARVTAETRAVAVSRVDKLIGAGNPAAKAIHSVAKELGVSDSAVTNWRTASRKASKTNGAGKKASPRADGKAAEARHVPIPGVPDVSLLGTAFLDLLVTAMRPLVTEMISEEIRRRLS